MSVEESPVQDGPNFRFLEEDFAQLEIVPEMLDTEDQNARYTTAAHHSWYWKRRSKCIDNSALI